MITKSSRASSNTRRTINASQSITSAARSRNARPSVGSLAGLTPAQRDFARQIRSTMARQSRNIYGATNTSNIMARPDFLEMLPVFVQKLLVLDVFGSVAMKSREQIIPYLKVVAEGTKGETAKNTVLSSAFVNRQGKDPNFGGRVVKNEQDAVDSDATALAFIPVLPGSVTISVDVSGTVTKYFDDNAGGFKDESGDTLADAAINYSTGEITGLPSGATSVVSTYQYDNESVGPDAEGHYGARMGKLELQPDEIHLRAEAHELACYWSVYSAFALTQEWGTNINDVAKESAFSELTAEINSYCFGQLEAAAAYKPQFNWDASPVLGGAVMPSDYLQMFKLKLDQAADSIYAATNLARPNRLVTGLTAARYLSMINGFQAENIDDTVGPYKFGKLDNYEIFVNPNYEPEKWVMCCKSNDIRRNSALFGEYMPLTNTDTIGLANASVQQGYVTMYASEIVNPDTIVSGRILGTY